MAAEGYRLGIDFGTSSTVAVLAAPGRRIRPLLFDSSPLLASAVFAGPGSGGLLTGADAVRAAVAYPAGLEANPKQRIDDGTVWLGECEHDVVGLIAAVLDRVRVEASRVGGRPPAAVVLTHPAGWGPARLAVLAEAATRAGLDRVRFIAEPVAAAAYFAAVVDRQIPPGRHLVVYDLGAGTFDVSVIRSTPAGFEVVVTAGLSDVGGLDLDAGVVGHARTLTPDAVTSWQQLDWPQTSADQQARTALWRGARAAKEQLSRHAVADLHVPLVDTDLHLTRDEFEEIARPYLARTAELTLTVLREAGTPRESIVGVFLVGGSSRIPLVATLLHRTVHVAPTLIDQPELVVAEGSLHSRAVGAPSGTAAAGPSGTPPPATAAPSRSSTTRADTVPPRSAGGAPAARRRSGPRYRHRHRLAKTVTAAFGAVVLAVTLGLTYYLFQLDAPGTRAVYTVAFSPDGKTLATGGYDRTVRLWDVATGKNTAVLTGHTDRVNRVAFSPDGKTLAAGAGGGDETIRLWNLATGKTTAVLAGAYGDLTALAFSPDGSTLAVGSGDNSVWLWNIAAGNHTTLNAPTGYGTVEIVTLAYSPDGKTLVTGGWDNTVRLWSIATGKNTATLTNDADHPIILDVVFSPDGTSVVVGEDGDNIRLWNVVTGRATITAIGYAGALTDLALSPDGKILATGGRDKAVRFWNFATSELVTVLTGHKEKVNAVAFSPDGRTLATGSDDDTARLWDVATGKTITVFRLG